MNEANRIVPIFIYTMLIIIDFDTVFIIKHMDCNIEINPVFQLVDTILFFIPFKFQPIYNINALFALLFDLILTENAAICKTILLRINIQILTVLLRLNLANLQNFPLSGWQLGLQGLGYSSTRLLWAKPIACKLLLFFTCLFGIDLTITGTMRCSPA